jgi:hypothetical protein
MLSAPIVTAVAPGQVAAKEQATAGGAIHIEFPGWAIDQRGERS